MPRLTHIAEDGSAKMVDVSAKPVSAREATASGQITLQLETIVLITENKIGKGNVFATARIAGIQAAKKTSELIPLCHPLNLTHVDLELSLAENGITAKCTARIASQTGVEMEALTGVSIALLTIYDMCKAVDKQMTIKDVKLVSKTKTRA